jgi:hypothetical protein
MSIVLIKHGAPTHHHDESCEEYSVSSRVESRWLQIRAEKASRRTAPGDTLFKLYIG